MKILYSQIKELAPGLKAGAKEVGEALTLAGFMMDGFTEVSYKNKKDYLISLEIRQNRADCLSVFGLVREVAAFYGLKIKPVKIKKSRAGQDKLDIKIEAKKFIKRVTAIKLTDIKNSQSPQWLKEYVSFHGLNSVNLLVDLSNYVMFLTGYPSHLIDYDKLKGGLRWSMNQDFKEAATLFGSVVPLKKNNELIIRDDKNLIALAGLVGGRAAEINKNSRTIIAEAAVYDRSLIRKNSRSLNIVTEASHRLEKELDPNGALEALELLASLIQEHAQGKIGSQIFDYYPKKYVSPVIEFNPMSPSKYAGIEIPATTGFKILKKLNFSVKKTGKKIMVAPPTFRQDVSLNEDLVEEVIRIYGYNKISADEIPKLEVVKDVTAKNIILAEKVRDILTALSFDEILSWPLVKDGDNSLVNYLNWQTIRTQNSINELFSDLRQSTASGLIAQLESFSQKNVEFINIFEIGKIFGERDGKYLEHESLGLLSAFEKKSVNKFKNSLENLLLGLGLTNLKYLVSQVKPKAANPASCWDIYANEKAIGIIYKLKSEDKLNIYIAEVNLDLIAKMLNGLKNSPVVELTKKLISLDANIELEKSQSIYKYLEALEKKLDKNNLFSLNIADAYPLGDKIRYTVRVVYKELSDQEAKKIHLATFNL